MKKRQINLVIGDRSIQYRRLTSPKTHSRKSSFEIFQYDKINETTLAKYNYISGIVDMDTFKATIEWAENIHGEVNIIILREELIDILHHLNLQGVYDEKVLNQYVDKKRELTEYLEARYKKVDSTSEYLKLKIK